MANQNSNGMGGGSSKLSALFSKFKDWLWKLPPHIPLIVGGAIAVVAVAVSTIVAVSAVNNPKNHVHSYGEWSVETAATCITEGTSVRYCECGDKQTSTVSATGHNYDDEWTITKEVTCEEDGSKVRYCACGEKQIETITSTGHNFDTEWTIIKEASCEHNGSKVRYCSCGEEQNAEIVSAGHSFTAWSVVDDATCSKTGMEQRACYCGETEERTIAKNGVHTEVVDVRKEPTCIKTGLTEGKHCSACGEVLVAQKEIPVTEHTYTDIYDESCNVCGDIRVAACRHSNVDILTGKAPTCTVSGVTEGKVCLSCGETITEQTILAPTGHKSVDWTWDNQPTCDVNGARHKDCLVCGVKYEEEVVPANGHTPGSTKVENRVESTCVSEGKYDNVVYCTVATCKKELSRNTITISKKDHKYVNYVCQCGKIEDGVYFVYDMTDLANMANDLSGTYVLKNDIDCQGLAIAPVGTGQWKSFKGVFDGQGYTISNYAGTNGEYVGIFGYNDGVIKNLNVAYFDIDITENGYEEIYVGGIVGFNAGTIEKCAVISGDLLVSSSVVRRGALICGESSGTIKNCYATGTVKVTQPYETNKSAFAAGIVAYNIGKVLNCFVDANIDSYGYQHHYFNNRNWGEGALIACVNGASATISNCFAIGKVTSGNLRIGDICGYQYSGGTITNCYKASNVTLAGSSNTHIYATALELTAMSTSNFYSVTLKWDSSVWNFTNVNLSNKIYPTLKQK